MKKRKKKDKNSDSVSNNNSTIITDELSLWNDREPKNKLINYIQKITKETDRDYVPKEDRIAVFDFDGTLFCETDPVYMDHRIMYYRVMEDSDYRNKATAFEKRILIYHFQ